MYDLYLASGATVLIAGILTSSYIIYSLYRTSVSRNLRKTAAITLSETLVAITIGAFYIYSYTEINKNSEIRATLTSDKTTDNFANNITAVSNNSTNSFCNCEEFWMQHAMLVISIAHCFITLVTTGLQCQKCIKKEEKMIKTTMNSSTSEQSCTSEQSSTLEQSSKLETEKKQKNDNCMNDDQKKIQGLIKNDLSIIFLQWMVPLLTIILMCLSIDALETVDIKNPVNEIQTLITDVIENPINISTNLKYKQDVDNIVSRVYSIIEQVASNQSVEYNRPRPEDIYNIIEMLEIRTREPKMISKNSTISNDDDQYKFKLYTFFFTIFDYLLPLIYSNVIYIKSKMCLKLNENKILQKRGQNELLLNVKYLRNSIILATLLWTPSFIEFLYRTFVTNFEPNTITQALMTTGNSYILLRYGINAKTIKNTINQSNYVLPLK